MCSSLFIYTSIYALQLKIDFFDAGIPQLIPLYYSQAFAIFSISHYYTNKFFSNLNRAFAQNKFSFKLMKVYSNQ